MRAFIAVDLTEEIQNRIAEIQSALRPFSSAVRWVRPASIHLTLKFLGEISTSQQQSITETLASKKSGVAPFQLAVARLGFFPNARAPRVVWLGIEQGRAELQALAQFVEASCRGIGWPPEDRPFSPHVTIGRLKYLPDSHAFGDATARWADCECGGAAVRRFFLYESRLHREGSIYTKRAAFELE